MVECNFKCNLAKEFSYDICTRDLSTICRYSLTYNFLVMFGFIPPIPKNLKFQQEIAFRKVSLNRNFL